MTDQDKTRIMEAIMRDQERRFIMNNIAKYAPNEVPGGKPRICQVLGVEDFERICEAVHNGWWEEKKRNGVTDHPDMVPYDELAESVKEYDRVTVRRVLDALGIRYESKPRFTEEEVAALRHMASAGVVTIQKKSDTHLYWDATDMGGVMVVPPNFLPSLRPGQSVALCDIVGGT